jgi:hypothetical protein
MASGGWRSIKCHNCPRHPVQGRELPRSYPFPYRVPVRGLPIAAPVHFDASSRKDVLSVPASPPRLQLSVQLKRSTQDFRDGLPCTFPGSDRPFPLRMLIFLERSFHTISAISNLLCMSRHCFKGSLFCHNYLPAILPPRIPACGCKDLIIDSLTWDPLATFCPRVRGRGGPEDIVSHNWKLVHCNLYPLRHHLRLFVVPTQSHLAYFCTPTGRGHSSCMVRRLTHVVFHVSPLKTSSWLTLQLL